MNAPENHAVEDFRLATEEESTVGEPVEFPPNPDTDWACGHCSELPRWVTRVEAENHVKTR